MPTKQPTKKSRSQLKKEKDRQKNIVIIAGAVLLCAILAVGYLVLGGPSAKVKLSPEGAARLRGEGGEPVSAGVPAGSPLYVAKARLQLASDNNRDSVKVVVDKEGNERANGIKYRYEWTINGQAAGDSGDSISGFKRGDNVSVKIVPYDGERQGPPKTLTIEIQNTTPAILEVKELKHDAKGSSYQVVAKDNDNDVLTYGLTEAPSGMTIDSKTGVINWQVKEGDYNAYTATIKISDNKGAETTRQTAFSNPKPIDEKKR